MCGVVCRIGRSNHSRDVALWPVLPANAKKIGKESQGGVSDGRKTPISRHALALLRAAVAHAAAHADLAYCQSTNEEGDAMAGGEFPFTVLSFDPCKRMLPHTDEQGPAESGRLIAVFGKLVSMSW